MCIVAGIVADIVAGVCIVAGAGIDCGVFIVACWGLPQLRVHCCICVLIVAFVCA